MAYAACALRNMRTKAMITVKLSSNQDSIAWKSWGSLIVSGMFNQKNEKIGQLFAGLAAIDMFWINEMSTDNVQFHLKFMIVMVL